MKKIKKILAANRSEIAIRIFRAAEESGIRTAAIYSKEDRFALHRFKTDESYLVGEGKGPIQAYLDINSIIDIAKKAGVDAIHPGYGFLSENPEFADLCEKNNITFIGPTPEILSRLGNKTAAKDVADEAGVSTIPSVKVSEANKKDIHEQVNKIGYPVIVKASWGGGGRGMRVVRSAEELSEQIELAQSESKKAFGKDEVFIEKFLEDAAHIEVQILGDKHGNIVHLYERDCSLQRRHQKIIEESPAIKVDENAKKKVLETILQAMKKIKYRGAGTIEMLYEDGRFYFIEMNTRLQVEHPITEMVTGIDIVNEQIKAAAGKKLKIKQKDIKFYGHSIECRINAEDPKTFFPSPGLIKNYHSPGGNGVRVDSAAYQGYSVVPYYDSLLGKLIVHAPDRKEAIARMKRALDEFVIEGINTTIELHKKVISTKDFKNCDYDIKWLETYLERN